MNCLHVLDELRELEEKHRDTVVIIGVHSPKFVHEAEHQAVVDAVERYEVQHPVLDDPELATWKQYAVRAWPTLVVDRPRGVRRRPARRRGPRARHREAGRGAGGRARREGHAAPRRRPVRRAGAGRHAPALPRQGAAPARRRASWSRTPPGTSWWSWRRTARPYGAASAPASAGSRTAARRGPVQRTAGPRRCCPTAGSPSRTPSTTPSGRSTSRPGVRPRWPAPAGSGGRAPPTSGPAREVDLSSPWDIAWFGRTGCGSPWPGCTSCGRTTRAEPARSRVAAGTTNEGLVDGPGRRGLVRAAVRSRPRPGTGCGSPTPRPAPCAGWTADGRRRTRPSAPASSTSATATEPPNRHCSSTRWASPRCPDGSVAVSDTYNHALRRYDPATGEVTTLATDLREPSDAVLVDGDIVVVESARHRLTRLRLPEEAVRVADRWPTAPSARPPRWPRARCGWTWSSRRPPGRSSTPATGPRPGCWSPRPRRSCWPRARARART